MEAYILTEAERTAIAQLNMDAVQAQAALAGAQRALALIHGFTGHIKFNATSIEPMEPPA